MLARFRKTRGEDGFTLIELLVVILIIGILIAIGIPAYLGVRNRGYDTKAQSNLKNGATGAVSFYEDNSESYSSPTALSDTNLGSYVGGNIVIGTATDAVHVVSASGTTATLSCVSASGRTYYAHLDRTSYTINTTP